MKRGIARLLLRLYPSSWRQRYGIEFEALLLDTPAGWGSVLNVVCSAVVERIRSFGHPVREPDRLESWCIRAPWAMFTLPPLACLALCYALALAILWSGWHLFLPQLDSPFTKIHGWAIPYFGIGKTLFLGAPVFSGWLILLASRRLTRVSWPLIGLVLVIVAGTLASVHADRSALPAAFGHIRLTFELGTSRRWLEGQVLHAVVILTAIAIPWFSWQLRPPSLR